MSALAQFQVTESTVGDTLQRVADIAVRAIDPAAAVGLTVLGDEGEPMTAVYTDAVSPAVDAAQYRDGAGPCLDAWREGRVVRVDHLDLRAEDYPAFVATCRARGIESTMSLPLVVGDVSLGAFNLYAHEPEAFDDEDEALAFDLAGAAGVIVANVSAYWTAFELGQQLDEAMRSRAVIEQAKGILMAQSPDLDADGAFEVLRQASQRENVKLRDIAQRIVSARAAPIPPPSS